jgi:hypothetical protein
MASIANGMSGGKGITAPAHHDQGGHQALIVDVDRERYVSYWSPDAKLLAAMSRPALAEHGPLAGETGGLVWIKPSHPP